MMHDVGQRERTYAGRRWLLVAAGALALAAGSLAAGEARPAVAQDSVLDEIKQRGTLRVAGVVYRPLIMRRPSGEYYGADVEFMGELAKELGVGLEFVNAGWDTAVAGITTGKWDMVPAICVTPEREEVVDFSVPYMTIGGVVTVLRENDKINSVEDADRPEVLFANVAGGWSEQIAREAFPNATHKEFGGASDDQLAVEVLSGRADAAIFDTPVTIALIVDQYGDRFKFFPSATEPLEVLPCPVAYAHKKGDEAFGQALNDFITSRKESGALQAMFDKYMTADFIRE
jgi:ABC-type amino acid transport substrate-binding protein